MNVPRGLVFLSAVWLVITWVATVGLHAPMVSNTVTYGYQSSQLIQSAMVGMTIAWPLVRLTVATPSQPVSSTLLDALCLGVLAQLLIWPLREVCGWTVGRAFVLDGTILGWLAVVAGIVTAGRATHRTWGRVSAMTLLVAVAAAGPIVATMLGDRAASGLGPLSATSTIAGMGLAPHTDLDIAILGQSIVAAVIVWAIVAAAALHARPAHHTIESS
jgi:hypothetical protein